LGRRGKWTIYYCYPEIYPVAAWAKIRGGKISIERNDGNGE
jgi:hypothetical protein